MKRYDKIFDVHTNNNVENFKLVNINLLFLGFFFMRLFAFFFIVLKMFSTFEQAEDQYVNDI